MCIRDSFQNHVVTRTRVPASPAIEEIVGHLQLHAFVAVDAVSYTHLRAHETVLDLVCRLLLEKKNDTNT